MSKGRIDQMGSPAQIYAQPATPFVADFIGKMNFLAGRMLTTERLHVAGAKLTCTALLGGPGRDTAVTVCLRPEDVAVRTLHTGSPNVFEAQIGVMEFIGNHFATTLHVVGTNLNVSADFSINDVRDLGIAAGKTIRIALPPERLRVFPQVAATTAPLRETP